MEKEKMPILGADVLLEYEGGLKYLYQILGDEYIYLNWHCDELDDESYDEYLHRSCEIAGANINNIISIDEKYGKECYITFVV